MYSTMTADDEREYAERIREHGGNAAARGQRAGTRSGPT